NWRASQIIRRELGVGFFHGDSLTIGMPAYEPNLWNAPQVINDNNCYNYAIDRRDSVRRNPGALAGRPVQVSLVWAGWAVAEAAEADGLQIVAGPLDIDRQTDDLWLAALVTAPPPVGTIFGDYHWYRRDEGGMWSHKSGFDSEATNLDEDGNPIDNPETCARGQYVHFFGYFIVDRTRLLP
ncbi:MAG TPA: hypothetical protein VKU41_33085, partial [Polyangiaceae bacterium]|nr:hypothetical protein [Polyangiaceae bacterium]